MRPHTHTARAHFDVGPSSLAGQALRQRERADGLEREISQAAAREHDVLQAEAAAAALRARDADAVAAAWRKQAEETDAV